MKIRQWVFGMAAVAASLGARAELGGPPTWSKSGVSGSLSFSQSAGGGSRPYTVNQTVLTSGAVVREYVAAGTVFAIAWQGAALPPLNTLLGSYFPSYMQGLDTLRAMRTGYYGPASVEQQNLVVQSGGHMGSFVGRAYLPQTLPQGVSAGDIQ